MILDYSQKHCLLHGFDDYCVWTGGGGGNFKKVKNDTGIHTYIIRMEVRLTLENLEDIFSNFIIDFIEKQTKPYVYILPNVFTTWSTNYNTIRTRPE